MMGSLMIIVKKTNPQKLVLRPLLFAKRKMASLDLA